MFSGRSEVDVLGFYHSVEDEGSQFGPFGSMIWAVHNWGVVVNLYGL